MNILIVCELCQIPPGLKKRPVCWKYNFDEHLKLMHPSQKGSTTFHTKLAITEEEIEAILKQTDGGILSEGRKCKKPVQKSQEVELAKRMKR